MPRPTTAANRLLSGSREPVRVASTANVSIHTGGLLTIDGVTVEAGDRVLLRHQTDATENGLYTASEGEWVRTPDGTDGRAITKGVTVHTQEGTANGGNTYVFATLEPLIGTDEITVNFFVSDDWVADAVADAQEAVIDAIVSEATAAADAASASATAADASADAAAASATASAASAASVGTDADAAAASATAASGSATAASGSATAAAGSATAADASASTAATSATAAQTAETNAETAEANAETAETNAEASATAAAASATAADASADAAALSATAAQTAETNAETAETNAETASTAAQAAETNAETAETNAETAATAAAGSATAAAASATAADASDTAAAASATAAAGSATAAAASATAADASADAAAASAASVDLPSLAGQEDGLILTTLNEEYVLGTVSGTGDVVGPASATGDNPVVFDGATGKLVKEVSYATFKTSLALVKGDVGLGNVDNTSDANKPVSTAQQTALDLKANLASPTFTGTPAAPTAAGGTNTTQLATTAFVTAAVAAVLNGVAAAGDTLAELYALITGHTSNTSNPHSVTKSQVGLANADNTADTAKPVSTAQQTALNLKANLASPTFTGTVAGITKSMVGLGNVDNTSNATERAATATLTNKTIVDPVITGAVKEDVFTITDGAGFAINPRNGSIQKVTLGASRTPTVSGWVDGDTVTLLVADGSAFTLTWSTIGVVWKSATAPTLATTGFTEISITRENGVYRGVHVGDFAS